MKERTEDIRSVMKLYIETLGCPKNFNDSEGIGGIWEQRRHDRDRMSRHQADAILGQHLRVHQRRQERIHRQDIRYGEIS